MSLSATNQSLLLCATPTQWLAEAQRQTPTLLLDQANCEKKAAGSAVALMHRSSFDSNQMVELTRIAREELKHLELVLKVMKDRDVQLENLSAGRYAAALHQWLARDGQDRLVDQLLVAGMIEARSCERIAALLTVLPQDLCRLYERLHEAEDRHFEFYVACAWDLNAARCEDRLPSLCELDAQLVTDLDSTFRFHSGTPIGQPV